MNHAGVFVAPHAHDESSVRSIMLTVCMAVLPCTALGLWCFGWPALNLLVITITATLAFEALAIWMRGQSVAHRLGDGSAVVAGWLLALTLPPWAPWWIGVLGAFVAMLLGKHAFGGVGQNVFNPAIVARVVLLVAFPLEMTTWPEPLGSTGPRIDAAQALVVTFSGSIPDALTGATLLSQTQAASSAGGALPGLGTLADWLPALMGDRPGSLGETSVALVLLGAAWLLLRRVISWHIPAGVVVGLLVPSTLVQLLAPGTQLTPVHHLTAGGALFASVFIATDPTTSPSAPVAQLIYAIGIGAVAYVIRAFCSLPEGIGFAVLLMNALVPTLDRKLKPRVYGRTRQGAPLRPAQVTRGKP